MDGSEIEFDAKSRMPVRIEQQPDSLLLEISDSLEASEQELQPSYKQKIADFLDRSGVWYPAAMERIRAEDGDPGRVRLLQIFVLSEQDADSITFGLMFRVEIDVEHGRGMKMDGHTLGIQEFGIGDVAFVV